MADFVISIDDKMLPVLKQIADSKGLTLEDYLRGMLLEDIERIRERMNDPIIGLLADYNTGEDNVSERADDILHEEWQPD